MAQITYFMPILHKSLVILGFQCVFISHLSRTICVSIEPVFALPTCTLPITLGSLSCKYRTPAMANRWRHAFQFGVSSLSTFFVSLLIQWIDGAILFFKFAFQDFFIPLVCFDVLYSDIFFGDAILLTYGQLQSQMRHLEIRSTTRTHHTPVYLPDFSYSIHVSFSFSHTSLWFRPLIVTYCSVEMPLFCIGQLIVVVAG